MRKSTVFVKAAYLVLLFLAFGVGPLFAERWGTVSANVGTLEIVRGGSSLPLKVERGTTLEEEDLLLTGSRGAEVIGLRGERVGLEANSALRLVGGADGLMIQLLSGGATVALPPWGEVSFIIRSGDLTARIRKGIAELRALPGDRRLVASTIGRHLVRSREGEERFAEPTVWVGYDGTLRSMEGDTEGWLAREMDAFAGRGPGYFAERMREYFELRDRFDTAYGRLLEHRDVLGEWVSRHNRGLEMAPAGPDVADEQLNSRLTDALDLSETMEERYFQLRMDLPYLSAEYQEYLVQESAYLRERLDFLRFLRSMLPPTEGQDENS